MHFFNPAKFKCDPLCKALGVPKLTRRLGLDFGNSNQFKRRQGFVGAATLPSRAATWVYGQLAKIPVEHYIKSVKPIVE